INAALTATAAHREVQAAVGAHSTVGHIEWRTRAEPFDLRLVAGSVSLRENRVDDAERPVAHEASAAIPVHSGLAVLRHTELVMIVELQAHRRTAARVVGRRQTVDVVVWRVGRPGPPDEVGPRRHVADAHRAIPGEALVPFHVAVEGP